MLSAELSGMRGAKQGLEAALAAERERAAGLEGEKVGRPGGGWVRVGGHRPGA